MTNYLQSPRYPLKRRKKWTLGVLSLHLLEELYLLCQCLYNSILLLLNHFFPQYNQQILKKHGYQKEIKQATLQGLLLQKHPNKRELHHRKRCSLKITGPRHQIPVPLLSLLLSFYNFLFHFLLSFQVKNPLSLI